LAAVTFATSGSAVTETFRNTALVLAAKLRLIEIAPGARDLHVFESRHAEFFQLNDRVCAYALWLVSGPDYFS